MFQINPVIFTRCLQQSSSSVLSANEGSTPLQTHKFIDPRTKAPVKDLICCSEDVDLAERNDLLQRVVKPSNLSAETQSTCLRYLTSDRKCEFETKTFNETEQIRHDERESYRKFVNEAMLKDFHRNDFIRPATRAFIEQKAKREALELLESDFNQRHRLISAFNPNNHSESDVKLSILAHERVGKVPELNKHVKYFWQTAANVWREFERQRNYAERFRKEIVDCADRNGVDVIIPLSVIRRLLKNSSSGYLVQVCVGETPSGRRIEFKKPLPRQRPRDKRRKALNGSKYVLRASACSDRTPFFDCKSGEMAKHEGFTESVEANGTTNTYKLRRFEDFPQKAREEDARNVLLTLFELRSAERSLKVMVPSKQDAVRRMKDDSVQFVNLSSKVETKAEYGAECLSQNELIYEWCGQYFRPETVTERCKYPEKGDSERAAAPENRSLAGSSGGE